MPFLDPNVKPDGKEGFNWKYTKRGWMCYKNKTEEEIAATKKHMLEMRSLKS